MKMANLHKTATRLTGIISSQDFAEIFLQELSSTQQMNWKQEFRKGSNYFSSNLNELKVCQNTHHEAVVIRSQECRRPNRSSWNLALP